MKRYNEHRDTGSELGKGIFFVTVTLKLHFVVACERRIVPKT